MKKEDKEFIVWVDQQIIVTSSSLKEEYQMFIVYYIVKRGPPSLPSPFPSPHLATRSASDGKLIAFVEDNSANGTFVNKVKLEKGVRRILRNGDLISLINPEVGATLPKNDLEKTSFYVHLYLEDGTVNPATKAPIMKAITEAMENNNNNPSSGLSE
jgi:hypothetical protein